MTNNSPIIGGAREHGQQAANDMQKITYGMHYLHTLFLRIKLGVSENLLHFSSYYDANSIIALLNQQGAQAAYETLQDAYGNYKKEDGSDDPYIIKSFIDGVKSSLFKNSDSGKYDLLASSLGLQEKFLIAYKQAIFTPELNGKFKDYCTKSMLLNDAFCELDIDNFNEFFNLDLG